MATGLKSPFGSRGAICAHYGWSWQYLHWGIRYTIVQRMMIDAPGYKSASKSKSDEEKPLPATSENVEAFMRKSGMSFDGLPRFS
ncbi:hypothetical protein [Spirosoma terrae]|uniref:Uncharacterized protein n=1 Tax=Spirosoma terrae TaxID=1968276 RepID=A0A6L9LEB3_9BACT|nr:hypothetical protein [Spirosoma terrae]NDU97183.1 hypothetical protein [Spirosoma terrae]